MDKKVKANYFKGNLQGTIKAMLIENTGSHMCDSGGANGRAWQRNASKDFEAEELLSINGSYYGKEDEKLELDISISVYKYLMATRTITDRSKALQKQFNAFVKLPENRNESDLANMESFCELMGWQYNTYNTYNYDSNLSQVLQGCSFNAEADRQSNFEYPQFELLQIHGGCDVRGGYTSPVIFEVNNEVAYNVDNISLTVDSQTFDTDDGGRHWYRSEDGSTKIDLDEVMEVKEGRLYSKATGELVTSYSWLEN